MRKPEFLMTKMSVLILAASLGLVASAQAQSVDGGAAGGAADSGVGVTSSPVNTHQQLPAGFFNGPFNTNMPIAYGPGPADNGLAAFNGSGVGGSGAGSSTPGFPGRSWGFGAGRMAQPQIATATANTADGQPATTGQPAQAATRGGPGIIFGRFGR